MKNYLPLFLVILFSSVLFSCKKDQSINPAAASAPVTACETRGELQAMPETNNESQKLMSTSATNSVVTIPVVFHVVYNQSSQNISNLQIQSQIDVLNEDFNAMNADIVNVPSCFAAVKGNAQIQFVLAKRDPSGNATNGITRTYTNVTSFSSDGTVCFASSGGHNAWPSGQYLNIWVCNKTGAAGSASYPWSGQAATDGIIVGYNYVGRTGTFTNNWSYQKGRTITHEVGHWLGLGHIWGDATCGNDLVNDTPPQQMANGASPVFPHLSNCSGNAPNGDMFMNFMDYTYDATRIMFSQGQVTRMHYYLNGSRASLLTSMGAIAPSTNSTTTCNIPSGLSTNSIAANSATITWASTGASSYNIRYRLLNSSTWSNSIATTSSLTLNGLTASTTYEFQVASVCSSTSTSNFSSSATFTTSTVSPPPVACNTPGGTSVSLITSNSAKVSWLSSAASGYTIRYRPVNTLNWMTFNTSSTLQYLTGLLSSTTYEVQVMSNCTTSTSSWTPSVTFTTKILRGNKKA